MTTRNRTTRNRTATAPKPDDPPEAVTQDSHSNGKPEPLTKGERRAAGKAVRANNRLARKAHSAARKAERAANASARAANRAVRQAQRARAAAQNAGAANLDAQSQPGVEVKGKKHTLQDAGQNIMRSAFKGAVEGALAGAIGQVRELMPGHPQPEPVPQLEASPSDEEE